METFLIVENHTNGLTLFESEIQFINDRNTIQIFKSVFPLSVFKFRTYSLFCLTKK